MDSTGKVLLKAAKLIEQHGWTQDEYGDRKSGFCLIGALMAAHNDRDGPYQYVRRRLGTCMDVGSVVAWNDAPGRTAEEVIDALVAAAYWEQS